MRLPPKNHVHAWLLLMPAAILLIAFTHYPTVTTVVKSLFSKGTAIRPSRFTGLANYQTMTEDPVFWKVLGNNLWFALGTIPTSIALAILMPTTLFVSINAVLNSFKLVDHLFVLTKGGPDNASNLLLYYIFETAFSYFETHYAAALTVVLLLLLAAMALGQFFILDKRVHYR